jgi:hypothetical protein
MRSAAEPRPLLMTLPRSSTALDRDADQLPLHCLRRASLVTHRLPRTSADIADYGMLDVASPRTADAMYPVLYGRRACSLIVACEYT